MPFGPPQGSATLRGLIHTPPILSPDDSLDRAVALIRQLPAGDIPVIRDGTLVGAVAADCLSMALRSFGADESQDWLKVSVAEVMRAPECVCPAEASVAAAANLLSDSRSASAVLVDADGKYLGVVRTADLLGSDRGPVYPAPVGGMATPFGVYLTNGDVSGGVGNLALAAGGVLLGLLASAAAIIVAGAEAAIVRLALFAPVSRSAGLSSALEGLAVALVFMALMRATRVASFHAAEHQVVHAMERAERLEPEIVSRMPRVHPRCGTNLWAGATLFVFLLTALPLDRATAGLVAGIATMLLWRRAGSWIQQNFTTRPAARPQIESGIAAARQLTSRYMQSPVTRRNLPKRIWRLGLLQTAAGAGLSVLCVQNVLNLVGWQFAVAW